jgi:atypical dual specificity phosphatase
MWTWALDWGRVRADLIVGSCPVQVRDLDRIRGETGATALLSLQTAACRACVGADYAAHRRHGEAVGLVLENAPMNDFDPDDQRSRLPLAVVRLHALLAARHRVYVHCTAGINRAPLAVLGYLALVEGREPRTALAEIRRGRPQAEPYWEAFEGCRADLRDCVRDLIEGEVARRDASGGPGVRRAAEAAVIRAALTQPTSPAGERVGRRWALAPGGPP